MRADRIDHCSLLPDEQMSSAMKHQASFAVRASWSPRTACWPWSLLHRSPRRQRHHSCVASHMASHRQAASAARCDRAPHVPRSLLRFLSGGWGIRARGRSWSTESRDEQGRRRFEEHALLLVLRQEPARGSTVFICDECVELCIDIIREENKNKSSLVKSRDGLPTPFIAPFSAPAQSRHSLSSAAFTTFCRI
jgi:ClpX C4-type zinc finger